MTAHPPPESPNVRHVASGTGKPPEMGGQITHGSTPGQNVRRAQLTGLERDALVSVSETGGVRREPPPRVVNDGLIEQVGRGWRLTAAGRRALQRGWWLT